MDRRAFLTGVVAAGAAAGMAAAATPHRRPRRRQPRRCPRAAHGVRTAAVDHPDVVVFLTDDMRADDWPLLRHARARIGGTWFPQFCYDVPLCAPTRATLLTGQMAHHHGIVTNDEAAEQFVPHEPDSLAPAVHAAGYHTAFLGKYLNGYHSTTAPPGWDDWQIATNAYHTPCGYATTELTRRAAAAILAAPADQPLFLVVAHHAPHSPSIPDTPYAKARVGPTRNAEDQRRKRCLLSVADSITALATTMGPRWDSAIVLALSDNGFLLGEHDRRGKAVWWDQAERVPLLARLSATSAGTDHRLVSSIDICPTLVRATGARATWAMDGLALQDPWDREAVLIADYQTTGRGTPFVGVKGAGWVYVEPTDGPARYYADRAEQVNRIDQIDPAPLHARVQALLA
jgi:arylsulfatase A-like enzyme